MKPVRLQLSRRRGFDLQALSLAINGLQAVNCARPGKWGNPFVVGSTVIGKHGVGKLSPEDAVNLFRLLVQRIDLPDDALLSDTYYGVKPAPDLADIMRHLRGKNLACWCPLGALCHGDVLLAVANR